MKYRKKSDDVDAIQYKGYMTDEVKNFIGDNLRTAYSMCDVGEPVGYFIKTKESPCYRLSKGDYIIKTENGEFYTCKEEEFLKTYDIVDDTSTSKPQLPTVLPPKNESSAICGCNPENGGNFIISTTIDWGTVKF